MECTFDKDPEPLLATLAQLLSDDGMAREVAVVINASAQFTQYYDEDAAYSGIDYEGIYDLHLQIPTWLFSQVLKDIKTCELRIAQSVNAILLPYDNCDLQKVIISPIVAVVDNWREKARAWVEGEGVTNQGRVRSDNVAARRADGLLFRSEEEIQLYKAFKALGVSFAPLPVFLRGGQDYKRIEPDFVIIKDGIMLIVEVDGDTVHHETPAEAHARTTMLAHEGAHVERVKAGECRTPETAKACAARLMQVVAKLKSVR